MAASVHAGGFQRSVRRWVKRNARELNARPTAFLSVCLGILENDPKVDAELRARMQKFLDATGWEPQVKKFVAGALPWSKYGWLKTWVMVRIVTKVGGDTDTSKDYEYTDWEDLNRFGSAFAIGTPAGEARSLAGTT